jgi:hypothetical protein
MAKAFVGITALDPAAPPAPEIDDEDGTEETTHEEERNHTDQRPHVKQTT